MTKLQLRAAGVGRLALGVLAIMLFLFSAASALTPVESKSSSTTTSSSLQQRVFLRTLSSEYEAFLKVFGETRMKAHFPTYRAFLRAAETTRLHEELSHLHLGCSEFLNGRSVKRILQEKLGKGNVETVHSSSSQNLYCLLVFKSDQYSADLFSADELMTEKFSKFAFGIKVWEVVPPVLKVHPSVLSQFGLLSTTDDSMSRSRILSSSELQNSKLVVSRKLPFHKASESKEMSSMTLQDWFLDTGLHFNHHHYYATKFSEHYDEESKGWNAWQFSDTTDGECLYSNLQLENEGENFAVTGLQGLFVDGAFQKCIVRVLAALAVDSSTTDVRLRQPKRTFNRFGKGIVQTKSYNDTVPYSDAGLNGSGQVVGVGDSGVDEHSCYFRNDDGSTVMRSNYTVPHVNMSKRKVVQYIDYADDMDRASGHGTHVCGTLSGLDIEENSDKYDGHASASKIAFFDMEDSSKPENGLRYPSPMAKFFDPARWAGARVHSNSWGGVYNFYDGDTSAVDGYMYDHDDFLIVFAAGNDGDHGYYSLGDPGVSKNALTVGASFNTRPNFEDVAWFSSLGPTFDGRIKPDVIAPGYYIFSAKSSGSSLETCATIGKLGTSMATPGVAGVAAQIRQYFEDPSFWATSCAASGSSFIRNSAICAFGAFSPRGATVKAVIIHSAEPMKRYYGNEDTQEPLSSLHETPDSFQGFGRVALPNALPLAGVEDSNVLYVEETALSSHRKIVYHLEVKDASRPLKATIAWADPPPSSLASKVLIHDFDLRIDQLGGETGNLTWFGNNLPGDDVNSVEQVHIPAPSTTAVYLVTVTSKELTESLYQKVSIVFTGAEMEITSREELASDVTYPSNELGCSPGQMMVPLRLMDAGADGWGLADHYSLSTASGEVVSNGTLSVDVPNDFSMTTTLCLPSGTYDLQLTDSSDSSEMGLAVQSCSVYLSSALSSTRSAQLEITQQEDGLKCNPCPSTSASLPLLLVGSFYGVPYGWVEGVSFELSGGGGLQEGVLCTGNLEERELCLPDGEYTLRFRVAEGVTDDFFDDDRNGRTYGMEEYLLQLNDQFVINLHQQLVFTVSGGFMTNDSSIVVDDPTLADDDDALTELVIVIIVSIIVGIALVLIVLCAMGVLYCGREKPLTREEVESQYRGDINELMNVDNPLQAQAQRGDDGDGSKATAKPRKSRRFSAKIARRFSNFEVPDWRTKLEKQKVVEPNPNDAL